MNTTKLKSELHNIVDNIENEQLLQTIYDFLKTSEYSEPGTLWASLNDRQKHELLLSFEESKNSDILISNEDVFQ